MPTDYLVDNRANTSWQQPVEDKDLTTSPSVSKGTRYIIAGTGGAWSGGSVNDIAQYNGVTWDFYTPVEGWKVYVKDEDVWYFYDGSSWTDNLTIGGDLQVDGGYFKIDTPSGNYQQTLTLQSQGTDKACALMIKGSSDDGGNSGGEIYLYDEDKAEYMYFSIWGGVGYIGTFGTSPGALVLQGATDSALDVYIGLNVAEGDTGEFRVYGYPTGGAKKYGILKIDDTTSDFHIGAENDIVLNPTGGNVKVEAKLETNDEFKMKVYAQNSEPTLSADEFMAIWKDTDDANKIYLLFRRGTGDQVSVELA